MSDTPPAGAERIRLAEADQRTVHWKRWGPYLSERAWGTVREDYSPGGTAWEYFPHDHARSRAYRWNEDGLAGWCDDRQLLCFALAFWNGRDPILKERIFGLTGNEGNHGEDAKEYWWYVDSTPTHSYAKWRYHYPQNAFPYDQIVAENRRRTRRDFEYELLDTGVFDGDRYWQIEAEFAKATPNDTCVRVTVRNAGPDEAELHVLPTLWFRNDWSWEHEAARPRLWASGDAVLAEHHELGRYVFEAEPAGDPVFGVTEPDWLFCDNVTNGARLWRLAGEPFPKDGINDHVVGGTATVNPSREGTKVAAWYRLRVAPGATRELMVRLHPALDADHEETAFDTVLASRRAEADEYYASLTPPGATEDEARVMRQAFAGLLWSKQFFHYDVDRWLDGDPGQPVPPSSRLSGRNAQWRHLNNYDVISMPDKWEYPWYAAWDLAFHCVALAHVDPDFAKRQLILMLREWYMHPNGQIPAYEWAFSDVNPPVHAWAAMRVFEIDGRRDYAFLERVCHKLLLNFTWWVNRKDAEGNNVFEGGFLGLDNIGAIDRSSQLPDGAVLEQSDGTAWMAKFCLDMLEMTLTLAVNDRTFEDVATKFFEHFTFIASAMNNKGLWDEGEGFYFDVLHLPDGPPMPMKCRSIVGLVPLTAATVLEDDVRHQLPEFAFRMGWFERHKPQFASVISHAHEPGHQGRRLLSVVSPDKLGRILAAVLDESEFLSPHGIRSLSRRHLAQPMIMDIAGSRCEVDYEPAESMSGLFGGNSNWRGPVWFPINYLIAESLRRYRAYLSEDYTVECPTGSGQRANLRDVADVLSDRLISLFLLDANGRRPCYGEVERMQQDPAWRDHLLFHEYFHGDTGAGLGASHQTGWTALVADLIVRRAGK